MKMDDKDISEWGREIGERIDKFVKSKEIKELQENIRFTAEDTVAEVRRSVQEAADYVANYAGNLDSAFREKKDAFGAAGRKTEPAEKKFQGEAVAYRKETARQLPVVKNPKGRISGTLMEIFGTFGAVAGWTSAAAGYFLTFVSFEVLGMGIGIASSSFAAVIAGLCTGVAVVGGRWRRRAGRFKKYVKAMGEKDFYSIEGLAERVGKKEKFVIKDLGKMIRLGWFREGHLDEKETCFMLTNDSYQMYLDAQEQLKRQKEEEERRAEEEERLAQDPVRIQLKLAVEEGNECIRRIREVNDTLEGEEISGKLYRLEKVCGQIFGHIGDKPEKLPDIRKFMNYYLPTTLKLVERYREFAEQPVQGENIVTAKREIEDMLDDINGAFEKMFDKLFEEDALDVSTDISVLSTMLAQEGLLEDELKVK